MCVGSNGEKLSGEGKEREFGVGGGAVALTTILTLENCSTQPNAPCVGSKTGLQ